MVGVGGLLVHDSSHFGLEVEGFHLCQVTSFKNQSRLPKDINEARSITLANIVRFR
jgi:hypothetical protein